ncbi:hypothetical protein [Nostoc sp. NIES-3756]|uniref:hypothetical protein n=1 Tax=Nostoc sp. NIES-3756 TaxID=1751286 RepID=UPI001495289A|nr:hypothetical protein [Nostoc sp. NIES-3756]
MPHAFAVRRSACGRRKDAKKVLLAIYKSLYSSRNYATPKIPYTQSQQITLMRQS